MSSTKTAKCIICVIWACGACAKKAEVASDPEVEVDAASAGAEPQRPMPEKKPVVPPITEMPTGSVPPMEKPAALDAAKMPGIDASVAVTDTAARVPSPARDAQAIDQLPLPVVTCAAGTAAVCLDFETGKLPAAWRRSSGAPVVETGQAARGQYALHLPALVPKKSHSIITSQLGTITNVMYGRFRLFMMPGAPNGHGAMVRGVDQANNWYEVGFQFSSFHGNWHPPEGVPERWMDSKTKIPGGKWTCVEFLFDGATPAVTKIWSDGTEVTYYQSAKTPGPLVVEKFKQVEIGFIPYHGTSLKDYEGDLAPAISDMWIDDVVLDGKRIGCE